MKELMSGNFNKRKGFSTVLLNQGYVNRLDVLYSEAKLVYNDFDTAVKRIAESTGGTAVVPPIKGEKRARMKALFKYRDPQGDGIAWYRLTDLVRATIMYPTIESMYESLADVLKLFGSEGNTVKEFNDRYNPGLPGGYRDIQLVVQFKGHMCEVQLNTEIMIRAKQTMGHRSFEVIRELKAAIGAGDVERVQNALEFGRESLGTNSIASTTSSDDDDETITKDSLKWLLREKGAKNLIHDAAKGGHAEIVHALLSYGADANSVDSDGNSPLHHAVQRGSERCVWAILDIGEPNLDIVNKDGETALMKGYVMLWTRPPEHAIRAVSTLAQFSGLERMKAARAKVEEIVQKKFQNSRQLVQHCGDGDIKSVLELLRDFKSPNSVQDGKLAIEAAIEGEHMEEIEALLSFGADLKPHDGGVPLIEQAIVVGNAEVIKTLLEAGTPIDSRSFQRAIDEEHLDALDMLMESHQEELEKFEVWIPRREDQYHVVSLAKGLQRHVFWTTHTVDYTYQTVKKFDSSSGEIILAVNTKNYAHISLAEDEVQDSKMYEIALDREGSNEFRVRHSAVGVMTKEIRVFAETMKEGEFRSLRVSFDPKIIRVERYNFSGWELIMEYTRQQHNHRDINFCRVASYQYEAEWRIPNSNLDTVIIGKEADKLQSLLDLDISLETDEREGTPCMMTAIGVGDMKILKMLKNAGAPIDALTFQKAMDEKNVEALRILSESPIKPLKDIEVWTDSTDHYWDDFGEVCRPLTRHKFRPVFAKAEYFYQTVKEFNGPSGAITLAVMNKNCAHIAMAEDEVQGGKIYEIALDRVGANSLRGRNDLNQGWKDLASSYAETVKEGEYRSLRISFDPSLLKVERYDKITCTWELLMEFNREAYFHEIKYCRVTSHENDAHYRVAEPNNEDS